jgi:hypothetical protein
MLNGHRPQMSVRTGADDPRTSTSPSAQADDVAAANAGLLVSVLGCANPFNRNHGTAREAPDFSLRLRARERQSAALAETPANSASRGRRRAAARRAGTISPGLERIRASGPSWRPVPVRAPGSFRTDICREASSRDNAPPYPPEHRSAHSPWDSGNGREDLRVADRDRCSHARERNRRRLRLWGRSWLGLDVPVRWPRSGVAGLLGVEVKARQRLRCPGHCLFQLGTDLQ